MGMFVSRKAGGDKGFNLGALIVAAVLLLGLGAGGIAAAELGQEAWSTVMQHAFEVALGLVVGLITGEYTS